VRADAAGLANTLLTIGPGVRVVVAVDGPDAAVEAEARSLGAETVVLPVAGGSYAARNAALDLVLADEGIEVVAFTDAGCLVSPSWLDAHVQALAGHDMSGGAVEVPLPSRPSPAEYVDARRNLRQEAYVNEGGYAATCNLAVRRAVVESMRFDDRLQSGGDREFCLRARAAGFSLVYSPEASIVHPPRQSWGSVLAKARRVGGGVRGLPASELPAPRFGFGLAKALARGRGVGGVPWVMQVAALDYLRTRAFVRAAR
jgi:hypothetical protein